MRERPALNRVSRVRVQATPKPRAPASQVPALASLFAFLKVYTEDYLGFGSVGLFWSWYTGLVRARRHFIDLGEDRRAALATWLMLAMTAQLVNAFFDPTIEGPQVGVVMWTLFGMGAVLGLGARSISGRTRRRRHASPGDFDWMLVEGRRPVSAAHPATDELELSEELRGVLTGFDDLLAEEEQPPEDAEG